MLDPSLPRGSESARLLLDFASAQGVSRARCLDETGLRPDDLQSPLSEVAAYQEIRIVQNLVGAMPAKPTLGLRVGTMYSIRIYGIYGFAMLSAPTMRRIVETAVRYQELSFTLARASIKRARERTRLELDATHLPQGIRAFVIDHALATVIKTWREMNDSAALPRVWLPASRSGLSKTYRDALGLTPRFYGEKCRIEFLDIELDQPRTAIDCRAFGQSEQQCPALLRDRQARAGVAGAVRARLQHVAGSPPSMEQIAAEFHLSLRSLRRALSREGTSFRTIIQDIRRNRAEGMLRAGCSIAETADRLGYYDPAAFVNAYKRWHGTPPGHHRDHLKNGEHTPIP
ncbi:AraC family transcriptional regulator ligand-binding domain-containing protein [Mycobacterium sp. M23085]|uniref:AraC family transcriptional regulator n=1 Tax=Mycobacterium sp. M23085 TaxID=3378087 RepID=UPI0038782286